jgi:hypothetical protein
MPRLMLPQIVNVPGAEGEWRMLRGQRLVDALHNQIYLQRAGHRNVAAGSIQGQRPVDTQE